MGADGSQGVDMDLMRTMLLALVLAAPAASVGTAAPGWAPGSTGLADTTTADTDDDSVRVFGDVWTICQSKTGGCAVADLHGTAIDECQQYPVADVLWVYVTVPAALEVTVTGAAAGTWSAYTNDDSGNFTKATIHGTSCVVFDDPDLIVVRSNGVVDYEF